MWNKWREENCHVLPDLQGADINDRILKAVDLFQANLDGADLSGTKLNGARLGFANLNEANLNGAVLEGADLFETALVRTTLDGVDFSGALLALTVLSGLDLSKTTGLEKVIHYAPSSIGLDTIYRSGGKIPESFLRGAGVPEEFIVYMRSLVNNPIEYYSCFISYNSKDEECARRLYADLQAANVRCWFAPHDMKIGDDILDRIDEIIRARDKLLLILSHNSIQSDWVETEVKTAFEEERRRKKSVLFPVRLDDAVMDTKEPWAAQLRRKHIGDFTRWKDHDAYQAAFDRLLRDLKASAQATG